MENTDIQEDYKGCSTFCLEKDRQYCEVFEMNDESYSSCKQTCDSNNCNDKSPMKTLSCFVCDETVDSNNQTVGYGNPTCFSNFPDQSYVQQCRGDESYCVVDIETDWFLTGQQTTRIRRGCSKTVNFSNKNYIFLATNTKFCAIKTAIFSNKHCNFLATTTATL